MIDVNGVYFEPRQKVTELVHSAIYEGKDGYRYVVKRDKRNQAFIKLDKKRAELGLSIRKFAASIGLPNTTYIHWQNKGRVPNTELGVKTVMEALVVSESVAIELIEEV
ncbi:MAG TPA: hypothetical protein DIC28_05775 [Aerococcus urinaeequi]|nr:hypothetical protein [Aerococcus urinaeequi]